MKIGCKIESVVGVYFKKLLAKVVNLIFKYILSSYFIECDWRCSKALNYLQQLSGVKDLNLHFALTFSKV